MFPTQWALAAAVTRLNPTPTAAAATPSKATEHWSTALFSVSVTQWPPHQTTRGTDDVRNNNLVAAVAASSANNPATSAVNQPSRQSQRVFGVNVNLPTDTTSPPAATHARSTHLRLLSLKAANESSVAHIRPHATAASTGRAAVRCRNRTQHAEEPQGCNSQQQQAACVQHTAHTCTHTCITQFPVMQAGCPPQGTAALQDNCHTNNSLIDHVMTPTLALHKQPS